MNSQLKRVYAGYAVAVAVALSYIPWRAKSQGDDVLLQIVYAPFWQPPATVGLTYHFDANRILFELISLTLVLLLATFSLWENES